VAFGSVGFTAKLDDTERMKKRKIVDLICTVIFILIFFELR